MQTIPPTYTIMDNKWMDRELTYKDDEVEKEEQVLENITTKRECHGEIFLGNCVRGDTFLCGKNVITLSPTNQRSAKYFLLDVTTGASPCDIATQALRGRSIHYDSRSGLPSAYYDNPHQQSAERRFFRSIEFIKGNGVFLR